MRSSKKLRVAVVGCGQIADAHLQEIGFISTAELVAVCDQVEILAQQAARRFSVPGIYTNLDRMIAEARPDVVHVTTPPHTHAALACRLLSCGIHAYVEKPFTVDLAEADRVLDCARANDRLVCVGHDQLFDPAWLRLEQTVRSSRLGDVVHVDSIMGYNLSGPFGKIMMDDPQHWVHRLPGGLFQNNISHAIYKITPFLSDESPRIWATTASQGVDAPATELRVMIQGQQTTATMLFSSRARPVLRCARIYGTKATVEVDLDGRTLRWQRGPRLPGALGKVELPYQHWIEATGNLAHNVWQFLRCRQHFFAGMRNLFQTFYQAILERGQPPIAYDEIRRVTHWMDRIFAECRNSVDSSVRSREGQELVAH